MAVKFEKVFRKPSRQRQVYRPSHRGSGAAAAVLQPRWTSLAQAIRHVLNNIFVGDFQIYKILEFHFLNLWKFQETFLPNTSCFFPYIHIYIHMYMGLFFFHFVIAGIILLSFTYIYTCIYIYVHIYIYMWIYIYTCIYIPLEKISCRLYFEDIVTITVRFLKTNDIF